MLKKNLVSFEPATFSQKLTLYLPKGWLTLKADTEKSSGKRKKKNQSGKLVHTKSGKRKKTQKYKIFRA